MSETIPNFLTSIVTFDESWIHYLDSLSRQQSCLLKHSNSPPPIKFCSSLSAGKVMLLLFFEAQGSHEEEKTGFAQETAAFAPG